MRIGILDAEQWQTTVDFKTGQPVHVSNPIIENLRDILPLHPYPGDMSPDASNWVTDVALDINKFFSPQLMMLNYANAFFTATFSDCNDSDCKDSRQQVFESVNRFLTLTDYIPVIVGFGDLVTPVGVINTTHLDGQFVAGGMIVRHGGINNASPQDIEQIIQHPGVERIIDRDTFREQFGGSDHFYNRFPDHLMVAREGYVFRGVGTSSRPMNRIPKRDYQIPLHTPLGGVESLIDVAKLVLSNLQNNKKIALIVVEAVGCQTFPLPYQAISNRMGFYNYAVSESQYLALNTGQHFVEHPFPRAYRYYTEDDENRVYPFSGIFNSMPAQTIGQQFKGRSVAVGNRSIVTHATTGASISVECFARELYNHGTMAVLNSGQLY